VRGAAAALRDGRGDGAPAGPLDEDVHGRQFALIVPKQRVLGRHARQELDADIGRNGGDRGAGLLLAGFDALVVVGAFRRHGRAVLLEADLAVSAFRGPSFGARASWPLRPLSR
jgi:hypothetical protein